MLREEFSPARPFWEIETIEEYQAVRKVLEKRFSETIKIIRFALEEADPMEMVYPDNPNEYDDVIFEALIILSKLGGLCALNSHKVCEEFLKESIARRFGEDPNEERLRRAAQLLSEQIKNRTRITTGCYSRA
ncbi:hypothetical protein KEM60_03177 [Austwickia sp. TVS 96-490-7B]|uniref:hypothetical protein n=1 Tax=Austwickia sp. TVS 96-490-7B TaxID=2830843 RepID=UPI001C57896F|nr:hypothetical protein [Austwickia sp. TVS 96-490-7B]MBW3086948.1 hypothetical protein [Austwickia sp. TVS 96-490-7B]